MMLFQEPIKKPAPKRTAKSKRKAKPKKATVKKNLTVEKPKKAKKQKQLTAPELSPHEAALFARYQAGRMGIKD
jgi:formate dehydrogenase assembly factor FdhD